MRQKHRLIYILICLYGLINSVNASHNTKMDSILVAKVVNGFYDWYITSVKEKSYSDYQPRFIATINGMTTLDFSKYLKNLKVNGFSDSLIMKEKFSYSNCIDYLVKIKYSDFQQTRFTDLDEYEQSGCDFGNYFRWIGGQESIDGIRITDIKFISNDLVIVTIDYFNLDKKQNLKHYSGRNILTLVKIDKEWFIDSFDSWNKN